jgi:hypothetical protein
MMSMALRSKARTTVRGCSTAVSLSVVKKYPQSLFAKKFHTAHALSS